MYQDSDGGSVDALQAADINGLRVIAKPIAKVGTLDEHGSPFLSVEKGDGLENILNIYQAGERVAPHSYENLGGVNKPPCRQL